MNTSEKENIHMDMQSTGDDNELLNSDDDSIIDEIMIPKLEAILDELKPYNDAYGTMSLIKEKEHGFIIPERFFSNKELNGLIQFNPIADKCWTFFNDIRKYTEMVAFVNFWCDKNNLVNRDYHIIKPYFMEKENIGTYVIDVYRKIFSKDYDMKIGIISIEGYYTKLLDLEYLSYLLNLSGIKCSIDYDNNIFHYNIEPNKENNKQSKK